MVDSYQTKHKEFSANKNLKMKEPVPGLSQRAMERRMLNVKLKDKIRNSIIRQRTRVTDIVQYVTNTKWKWAGHIARRKDNRWTIRSTEWQTQGVRSV